MCVPSLVPYRGNSNSNYHSDNNNSSVVHMDVKGGWKGHKRSRPDLGCHLLHPQTTTRWRIHLPYLIVLVFFLGSFFLVEWCDLDGPPTVTKHLDSWRTSPQPYLDDIPSGWRLLAIAHPISNLVTVLFPCHRPGHATQSRLPPSPHYPRVHFSQLKTTMVSLLLFSCNVMRPIAYIYTLSVRPSVLCRTSRTCSQDPHTATILRSVYMHPEQ